MTWEVMPHGLRRKKIAPNLKETGFIAECRKQSSLHILLRTVKAVMKGNWEKFGNLWSYDSRKHRPVSLPRGKVRSLELSTRTGRASGC